MGRKLKVVDSNKKHLTNQEKEERKAIEIKASDGFTELQKTAPRHLNQVARAEYERIINDLRTLPVRNIDRALLDSYCTWYAIYKETAKKLDEIGYFVDDANKGLVANPLIVTLEKATTNIQKAASQLGLTVDSRMKMFIPKQEEKKESLFDKFGG
ncbi:phage terminase small subunit P27 family [Streptococcus hyovaginalis]